MVVMRAWGKSFSATLLSGLALLSALPLRAQTISAEQALAEAAPASAEFTCSYCDDYSDEHLATVTVRSAWRAGFGYAEGGERAGLSEVRGSAEFDAASAAAFGGEYCEDYTKSAPGEVRSAWRPGVGYSEQREKLAAAR